MPLTSEEVARMLQIARDATLGESFQERIHAVTDALSSLVPCVSVSAFVVDPTNAAGPEPGHLIFKNRNPSDLADYALHYRHVDPMGEAVELLCGLPFQLSDFITSDEFGRDEFTSDFLSKIQVRHILGFSHPMPGGTFLSVALHRDGSVPDFTPREREIVRLSSPDIGRAAFGALLRERVQTADRAETSLDENASGAIVLSPLGDMKHANAMAISILLQIKSTAGLAEDLIVAEVRRLAQRPSVEGLTVERRFPLESGGWARARFSWMSTAPTKSDVICLLDVLRPGTRAHFDTLAESCGLTDREREVAERTIRGLGNRQIARELGISPITVASHLTRVYEKTKTSGRYELTHFFLGS